jgi:hypothetical protein
MSTNLDFFSPVRVNNIMQGLYDPRLLPQPLVWSNRIQSVPASNDEITARFIGQPLIADIIADDSKAVTYEFGRLQYDVNRGAKIKFGLSMNESRMRMLRNLQAGNATRDEVGLFSDYERRTIFNCRFGVDMRRESLLIGMLVDGYNYDRLGVKLSGVTWGMPSDLKVTPSTAWTNTSATPITNIQTVRRTARRRYGRSYNRVTLSTGALLAAAATTEFQNLSKFFVTPFLFGAPAPASPVASDGILASLLSKILSGIPGEENGGLGPMTIEIDDRMFWSQDSRGLVTSYALWPLNAVVLTDSRQDGNTMEWDFANGELIESVVSSIAGSQAPAVPQGRGPLTYVTLADQQLNAPGVIYWGAQYGFPRKHDLYANAVLFVGNITDSVSTTPPF